MCVCSDWSVVVLYLTNGSVDNTPLIVLVIDRGINQVHMKLGYLSRIILVSIFHRCNVLFFFAVSGWKKAKKLIQIGIFYNLTGVLQISLYSINA